MQLRKTDLFTFIHKAIRSMIYNAGSKIQLADFADIEETKSLLASFKQDLELLHEHAIHEDNIIFPEIQQEEPEMILVLNEEHKTLEDKLNKVKSLINNLENVSDEDKRLALGAELNNLFNDFSASYLAHMNHEEATVLEASFKYLNDEELVAIRTRIQTQIPPERYKIWLNWMLKSLNNSELTGLLGGMKAGAPPHVFQNVMDVAGSIIAGQRFKKILTAIGL